MPTPQRPYKTILLEEHEGCATITLNRPERRNAIGPRMINELLCALEDIMADASLSVIVLTGAGKAFCAGADFSQMTSGAEEDDGLSHKGDYKDLLLVLLRSTKPLIARVNGHAMGGGLGLVAASTFAVAALEAKLGTPEINVGLFPFMIWSVLERVVPRRRLVEMMLTGERISAEEAAAIGLVNRAVPSEELDRTVLAYVQSMRSKSPVTLRLGLEALWDAEDLPLEQKLPLLSERLGQCLATEDAREGLMAFLEKRPPQWKGR
jgi:enoyl-CoA hydratase/carnithine racemase